jgi:hypothetical protein
MLKTTSLSPLKSVVSVLALASALSIAPSALAADVLSGQYHGASQHVPAPLSETYTVGLNKTEIVRLPSAASAVLVGNPDIADVSIHSADTIFVIGRSYGETNIVILDGNGHTVINANIQVNNVLPRNGIRVFYGGAERETYNCTPYCAAAPVLGDSPEFIGANAGAGGAINNTLALGITNPSSPPSLSPNLGTIVPANQ